MFIVLLLLSCNPSPTSIFGVKKITIRDTFINQVDQYIQVRMKDCNCPGAAITIIIDTLSRLEKGYGVRSLDNSLPVDTNTVFRLASVSKSFASVLASIEESKGKFHFSDKVNQYVTDFNYEPNDFSNQVSINNILSHSSGMPYHSFTNLVESGMALSAIIPRFSNIKVKLPPGEEYAYQNATYGLIEPILEKTCHQAYTDLLNFELIKPLGMNRMSYTYSSITSDTNHAMPHKPVGENRFELTDITDKYYNLVSAGGINASISDMNKWIRLLMGYYPSILSASMLDSLYTPRIRTTTDRRYYNYWPGVKDSYYSRGLRLLDYGDHFRIYHAGYANEFRAEIAVDPKLHMGICALFNSPCRLADELVPLVFQMYTEWSEGCR